MNARLTAAFAALLSLASLDARAGEPCDHAIRAAESGFEARNPAQSWDLEFGPRGFLVRPDHARWTWGLELVGYGFGDDATAVAGGGCARPAANRIAFERDARIEEWYVNEGRGVEHGFTVHARPESAASAEPLRLELRVRGSLDAAPARAGRAVDFLEEDGSLALRYSGLSVFDADGRALDAWFEGSGEELSIAIDEREGRYPLTVDPLAQQAYIKASNPDPADHFGAAVALSGDTLVVGAPFEGSAANSIDGDQADNTAPRAGAAYVFVRNGTAWSQQAYLKAANSGSGDEFGQSVAIDGDTIVVGARGEASGDGTEVDDSAFAAGAAYVFVRSGSAWSQQAYLKASNADPGDEFGLHCVVEGDTLVVGARFEDSSATGAQGDQFANDALDAGAAYVFLRAGTTWQQQAYLKASNTGSGDRFGTTLAISGDTLVVGASWEKSLGVGVGGDDANDGVLPRGAAYVFVRSGTSWSQQAYVKPSNTPHCKLFGDSLALAGDLLVVGAPNEDSGSSGVDGAQDNDGLVNSGAAYVFSRIGTAWSQSTYLKASNPHIWANFGNRVAVSGARLVVSARAEAVQSSGIDPSQAVPSDLNEQAFNLVGAAYVFEPTGATWEQTAYVKASNSYYGDTFGTGLALSDSTLAVGAPEEDSGATGIQGDPLDDSAGNSGAVYVFDFDTPLPTETPGTSLCSGDGGDQLGCTNCPCGNDAAPGTVGGCLNGTSNSTRLSALGSPSVSLHYAASQDLRFALEGAPPSAFCVLLSGDAIAPTNAANPCFGLDNGVRSATFDGLRCAVANTRRHGGRATDASGLVGTTTNPWGGEANPQAGIAGAGGGFVSGQVRYFQVVHRDDPLLGCMRGLNTSQAIEVAFTP